MESKAIMFSDREKLFKQKTGKDFTEIYQKYYPKLIYFTAKICKSTQKAEDVSTNAFIRALEKIETYDKEKAQFSTWLFTIGRNLALQEVKDDKKSISLDVEYDTDGTTMKDFISMDIESDNEYLHDISERKAAVMKKYMARLKEPYKTVIEMREIQKMAYKDIAEALGKNLSTIKSQIRNGRHLLISQSEKEFTQIDQLFE